jgi:hypothetical protein
LVERLASGPFWWGKCLGWLILCALVFTCVPVFLQEEQQLPPAYELKAQHPFADTSKLTVPAQAGERLHGNKLTFRVFGSLLLWVSTQLSLHPYAPAILGGCVLLLSGILIGTKLAEDRVMGLLLGMVYAGLYATSACLSINHKPKPFDGIALGLIGLATIMIDRPFLLFLTSFLGCWTDERTSLSLLYIAIIIAFLGSLERHAKVVRCASLIASIVAYFGTRLVLSMLFNWDYLDRAHIGTSYVRYTIPYSGVMIWMSVEGGSILVVYALWRLWERKRFLPATLYLVALVLSVASSWLLLDTSRAASFSFPLIPAALAILKAEGMQLGRLRDLTAAAAVISLLSPNFEVIAGVLWKWLPPLPMWYLAAEL